MPKRWFERDHSIWLAYEMGLRNKTIGVLIGSVVLAAVVTVAYRAISQRQAFALAVETPKDVHSDATGITISARIDRVSLFLKTLFKPPYDSPVVKGLGSRKITPRYASFVLVPHGHDLFPADAHLRTQGAFNSALLRYAGVEASRRQRDFALVRAPDYFWGSEYPQGDRKQLVFGCSFVIHLVESPDHATTRIEVIEYDTIVYAGERFGLGHNGPGFYRDYRPVAPTASDRRELLAYLKTELAGL